MVVGHGVDADSGRGRGRRAGGYHRMRADAVVADDDCGRSQGRTGRDTSSVKSQACAEVLCSCKLGKAYGL